MNRSLYLIKYRRQSITLFIVLVLVSCCLLKEKLTLRAFIFTLFVKFRVNTFQFIIRAWWTVAGDFSIPIIWRTSGITLALRTLFSKFAYNLIEVSTFLNTCKFLVSNFLLAISYFMCNTYMIMLNSLSY
jgi:hypothetical protein